MPFTTLDELNCYYRLDGREDRPWLVLVHSLGQDHGMWDAQLADLTAHFQVLRYDVRGHGASTATPGDYTIAQLGRDALELLDRLGIRRAAFCGLSLGGMIGQWLAMNAPDRIASLVLANTTLRLTDPAGMETRRQTVLAAGMDAVGEIAMSRSFSAPALRRNPPLVASARRTLLATPPIGYAGCCAALRDLDHTSGLSGIRTPTLVIGGDADVAMPWPDHGKRLVESIAGARAVRLPAGHLSNLELPRSFVTALLEFLLPPPATMAGEGTRVRRAVLGDAHVDRAEASATEFTKAFEELITHFAWGTIWSRPGLDHRTRRLLVLTTTAALGRWEEFRLHVATGFADTLEPCDVREALLQLAVYAGVPAANTAFHIASEELRAAENVRPS